jgi:hypothetical protein
MHSSLAKVQIELSKKGDTAKVESFGQYRFRRMEEAGFKKLPREKPPGPRAVSYLRTERGVDITLADDTVKEIQATDPKSEFLFEDPRN